VPLVYDLTIPKKSLEKVSTLRDFMRSFIELMKDENQRSALCNMIDHCA
jgi:hypothetical protein